MASDPPRPLLGLMITVSIAVLGSSSPSVVASPQPPSDRPAKTAASISPGENSTGNADSRVKSNEAPVVDVEVEQAARQLVQKHLPELAPMLKRLRGSEPREYARAIRDLARSARMLDLARNRGERYHETTVELLKARTHVTLLTARLKVRDSQQDRNLLRSAVQQLHQVEIEQAKQDLQFMQDRLQRARKQVNAAAARLETRKRQSEQDLESVYQMWLRKAGRKPAEETADKAGPNAGTPSTEKPKRDAPKASSTKNDRVPSPPLVTG